MIPSNPSFQSLHAALNGEEPDFSPIVLPEDRELEELIEEAEEDEDAFAIIEEIKAARSFIGGKGFG